MKSLLSYLNGLKRQDQVDFARRCKTSVNYLRKAVSTGQRLGESLCISIERVTGGDVRCEELRPDVEWWVVRGTSPPETAPPAGGPTEGESA